MSVYKYISVGVTDPYGACKLLILWGCLHDNVPTKSQFDFYYKLQVSDGKTLFSHLVLVFVTSD